MESLTQLESVLLGIVWKFGPCTPYAVRRQVAESPSHAFSSSTGSVYPGLRRLEKRRLVRSHSDARGRQQRRLYAITRAGERALADWFEPELAPADRQVPSDPLGARLYFLEILPPAGRRAFVEGAIAGLEQELARVRRYAASYETPGASRLSRLAAAGYLSAARARLRWLRSVRDELFGS